MNTFHFPLSAFNFPLSTFYLGGVCLPSDTKMTDEDLYRVCDVIKGL